jgi:uncharacterized protein
VVLLHPSDARWLFVLAHGAGAGSRHPLLESIARALADRSVATLRFDFPYVAARRRAPDRPAVLIQALRSAWDDARRLAPGLRVAVGGRSMGGRMSSGALAEQPEPGIEACVFLGFPLHPAARPGITRAEHLGRVAVPMLFVQGERDALAELARLRPVVAALGSRATLVEVAGADHGFEVPRRSGRAPAQVLDGIAATVADWLAALPGG